MISLPQMPDLAGLSSLSCKCRHMELERRVSRPELPEPGLVWGSMVAVWLLDWPFPSCYGLRPGQEAAREKKIKPGRWKGKEVRAVQRQECPMRF